jgi:hypothetical protein
MAARNRYVERRWLEDAAAVVPSGFVQHARERLEMGEALYGDRWASAGIRQLLAELRTEAADLGAWSALTLQALDDLGDDERAALVVQLRAVARAGAEAYAALETANRLLDAAEDGSAASRPNVARTATAGAGGS